MSTLTGKEELQLSFYVDWHDNTADVTRRFALNYYPRDNSVEMVGRRQLDAIATVVV